MKKLKLFFALFAMLALGVGNAWGAEEVAISYKDIPDGYKATSGTSGSFTKTVSATNDLTISYAGINTKSKASAAAHAYGYAMFLKNYGYIYSSSAPSGFYPSKVVVKFGSQTGTSGKAGISFGTNVLSTRNSSVTGAVSKSGTCSLENSDKTKLHWNFSTTSANVQVASITVTYTSIGTEETVVSVPTFSVPEGTFYSPINVELSCETADAEIHYTLDGSTPSSTSEKYTTAIAISETTTVKAIAVKDGLTDSEVATATYTKGETVTSYDIDFETNALEAYVNWDFSNITIAKTITAKGGTYYGNTSGTASASIKTKEKIQYPGILTFSVSKETNNTTSSSWKVQVSENGSTWTDVETLSATEMSKGAWKDHSVDLSDYENVYVQISYGSSTAVRAIDEISLAQGVAPEKYTLTINAPENGTLFVKKGGEAVASGDEFKAGTSLVVTPTPATGYVFESLTVDGSAVELTEGSYTFNMPAANVTISATFKENEKPAATLTLSKNGETEDITGYKQDDKVILPSITSGCVKAFVGWSADVNCATEPEYKEGEEYTLAETAQTLYAVYATVGGGGETTAANTLSSNGWANESKHTSLQIDANVKAAVTGGGNTGKYYTSGTNWRLYQNEDAKITISTSLGELKSVKFTFTNSNTGTLLYNGTKLTSGTAVSVSGTSATFTVGNSSASVTNGQIRISKIEVVYTGGVSYSNYSTTCAAALANPTFSLAAGKYTEAKSVTISAAEGTVYYTTDGTTPTASSTQYTGAIALNDCGEYTIKAIAISADSQSDVVSATYTIKLPLTNSQAAPYTEAEAIAVYNGDCYDNQDVYVKGTVKTATFYNSGTYTITLTNGFQFYKFYKDGSKTLFTDGEINKGDVLVACGKLSKYNTTYQLAEGCYLVEHEPYTEPKTDISNTEATAYTVDKAFELIADVSSDLTKEVFVKGLVAVAPTSNPTADGQMTYKISDNGENTGDVLTVYLGLNLNGEKFTSKNDVQQGDYVVVKGKLLDYNSTYELNKGNQLVQHKKAATIKIADITMEVGETKTIAATITPDAAKTEVAYSIKAGSDDCITLSDNNITAKAEGIATIVATIATAAEYMGKTVEFKVTVTPVNITTLPFAFDDGVNDIKNTLGMSQKNLGTDYGSSPKLKFDDTDDYVIIHFDERPGILSYDIKANTGSGAFSGVFAVQESADGVTYRDLVKYSTISGSKETKTHNCFDKDTRYIKFVFVAKDNGNVALGNIKIETSVVTKATPSVVENAYFSVGNGEFVQFSTGNLQYEVGTNTWSFASEQYEVIGGEAYDPANPTNTNYGMNVPGYTGKLDLFAWSCDGKFGVNPSNADADYTGGFADWDDLVSEAGWSTLTRAQMEYLLERKKDGKKLWGLATLEGKVALILLPDNWNTAIEFTYGYVPTKWNFTANELTKEDWNNLEANGAVLLPAGGSRAGGYGNKIGFDGETVETDATKLDANGYYFHVDNVGDYGYYWLSSTAGELADYLILPASDNTGANTYSPDVWSREKRRGNSVRLVKEITPNYTRTVTSGRYGTICLENGGQMIGASLFELSYYNEAQGLLYMDEADATMVAGNPYIFLPNERATKDSLYVFYDETTAADALTVNGLVGSFESKPLDADGTNYIMKDNKIMKVVGEYASVGAYKAYIKLGDVSKNEPAPVPGRRRVAIGQAPQVATGMESVDASAQPVKMIIDGQLYILRGEKMYDAQGKLVK